MPCGVQLELVRVSVQRETDVDVTDHIDLEIGVLPILPEERLHDIVREELIARGWEASEDGTLTKRVGDAIATLPPGESTIRVELSSQTSVSASVERTEQVSPGEGAKAAAKKRAAAEADRKLEDAAERAKQALTEEAAEGLLDVWRQLRAELDEVVNATTRRALQERGAELGAIESVEEGQGENGGYELTVTVVT